MTEKDEATRVYSKMLNKIQQSIGRQQTTSDTLLSFGSRLFGDAFLGVFAVNDHLPAIRSETSLIMNLDERGEPGSHWIALFWRESGRPALLYDSFGRNLNLSKTEEKLKFTRTDDDPEQRVEENNCGQRCLAFLYVAHKLGWAAAESI